MRYFSENDVVVFMLNEMPIYIERGMETVRKGDRFVVMKTESWDYDGERSEILTLHSLNRDFGEDIVMYAKDFNLDQTFLDPKLPSWW